MLNTNISQTQAKELIDEYPDWEGSQILNFLMHHPNQPIYSTVLETSLRRQIPPNEAQKTLYHLAPIRMTDDATLRAVDKRLVKLLQIQAAIKTSDTPTQQHPSTTELEEEIRSLIEYRKETTLPTGGIKCFHDEDRAAYRRQSAAIRRLLTKATKDGHHEAVAYIKFHLKQGKQMRWEES